MRDFQRAKVYAADETFDGYRFQSADAVRTFVERILRSAWWRKRSAVRKINVEVVSRGKYYKGDRETRYRGYIVLRGDAKSYDEGTILHEVAHILTPNGVPDHGPEYCHNYLDLVLKWMGPEPFVDLKDRFIAKGVQY